MKTLLHILSLAFVFLLATAFTGQSGAEKLMMERICDTRPQLKETLKQAGLAPLLMNNGPYTFFAPSEASLAKNKNADPGKLKDALMNHIISNRLLKEDFKDGTKVMTMGGKEVSVFRKGNDLLINGVQVSEADQAVKNGVIHTVENWLVAPN